MKELSEVIRPPVLDHSIEKRKGNVQCVTVIKKLNAFVCDSCPF